MRIVSYRFWKRRCIKLLPSQKKKSKSKRKIKQGLQITEIRPKPEKVIGVERKKAFT